LASKKIQDLIDAMIPAMYESDGIGLAAPQVGHNIRVCVIGKESDKKLEEDLVLVNPVWEKTSRKKNVDVEGCLSVPKTFGKVKRYTNIHVIAMDRTGQEISFEAKKFFARVIQHESDHLDGILFVDKAKDICIEDGDKNKDEIKVMCSKDFENDQKLKI